MDRKQERLNDTQARRRRNVSSNDAALSNRLKKANLVRSHQFKTLRSGKVRSSILGNLVAFGVPFVAVTVFIGVQKNFYLPNDAEVAVKEVPSVDDAKKQTETPNTSETTPLPSDSESESETTDSLVPSEVEPMPEKVAPTVESDDDVNENVVKAELEPAQNEQIPESEEVATETSSTQEETAALGENTTVDTVRDEDVEAASEVEAEKIEAEKAAEEAKARAKAEEEAREALSQLQYRFQELKKGDIRALDAFLEQLQALRLDAQTYPVPENLQGEFDAFTSEVDSLQKELEDNRDFLSVLVQYDQASLSSEGSAKFFTENRSSINLESPNSSAFGVNERRQELAQVGAELDTLTVIDAWNDLIGKRGQDLERFRAANEDAEAVLQFLAVNGASPGLPREASALKRRIPEWEFQINANVPTQRKILLRLEAEISQKYWTYAPSRDKYYYLPAPPQSGVNRYIADLAGASGEIDIPESAPETKTRESLQIRALRDLAEKARLIPDSLVETDPAQWYDRWREFLEELQTSKEIDPIVQYVLFRDCAKCLALSDYYFAQRIEPFLRMLNAPQLEEGKTIDRFQTESTELQNLRRLASSRVSFLPKNHLNVDKTTEQLNASIERFDFIYQRVGWLDRNLADVWYCRRPENEPLPLGDLYVLVIANDDNGQKTAKWSKIGESNGKRVALKLASNKIPIGSIIFCRVALHETRPVAKRASVEDFFNR